MLSESMTGGVWSPLSEKDKELALQIISIATDLVKVS